MTILKRFTIHNAVVSILEHPERNEIEIEIAGARTPEEKNAARNYLANEGLLETVLKGKAGLTFNEATAEDIMRAR